MKKIFFVYPPSVVMNREGRCQQPVNELVSIPPLPPIELMYLAAIAKNSGYECKIKDYSVNNETLDDFSRDLKAFDPDYLLINVATPTLESDLNVCCVAKVIKQNVVTIATGAYFLSFDIEVLENNPCLDLIIKGEPEFIFKDIIENKPYEDILGLSYRKNGMVVSNGRRPFIENLDDIPFPARDILDNNLFKRPDNNKVQTIIKVSRGCPFHCFFCLATPVSGAKVRLRSAKNIVDEIKECVEKYNIKNFIFWSDVFDVNRDWVIILCQEIIDSGLKITWSSNSRADLIDEELADMMYKSGCRLVSMGVESGSQEILDKMGKNLTLKQVRNAVKIFKKAKIKLYNYFVIGLPWEDEKHIEETIKFAIELNGDFVSFYTATALPGSRFYDYILENNLGDLKAKETYKNAYYYPSVATHHILKDRIMELHKSAMKRFYLRPSYIVKKIFGIRSFAEFKNYMVAGFSLLLKK